ncbi:transcription factor HES-4-B-like [Centruroides vittatus]|uniref:transcription factor HES-4-B-like n=1 Tax=Centruroides vittatus TaxID=120091 RepID=UPI0035100623
MPSVGGNMEKSKQENRRISKPLMEKRRRARINHSLSELKSLLLDAIKSESPRHSKMEKADLLELTVRHLQELHRRQRTVSLLNDPYLKNKFQAGYEECAREIERFVGRLDNVKYEVKQQLRHHLTCRMDEMKEMNETEGETTDRENEISLHEKHVIPEVRLLPRKLPNGDLALVLPQHVTVGGPLGAFLIQGNLTLCHENPEVKNQNEDKEECNSVDQVWRPW